MFKTPTTGNLNLNLIPKRCGDIMGVTTIECPSSYSITGDDKNGIRQLFALIELPDGNNRGFTYATNYFSTAQIGALMAQISEFIGKKTMKLTIVNANAKQHLVFVRITNLPANRMRYEVGCIFNELFVYVQNVDTKEKVECNLLNIYNIPASFLRVVK